MNLIKKYLSGDQAIWLIALALSFASILAVYSTTGSLAFKYRGGNTEYYALVRVLMLSTGFVLMYFVHKMKYIYFSKIARLLLAVTAILLLITLLSGARINQANRWLTIPGLSLTFQTSDLAKLVLLTYLAAILAKKQSVIKDFKEWALPVIVPILVYCGLIFPANFSTAALLFANCILLMFVARVRLKDIGKTIGITMIAGVFGILILAAMPGSRFTTWKARIENFGKSENKDASYQSDQAKIAIATGGIIGKGPGRNPNKYFLPHSYSDFIYAIIIGEYGILGGIVVLSLYLMLFTRSLIIARQSEYAFATFLVIGLASSIFMQAATNIAVSVGVLPVTGQPLPMISMGGTSTLFTSITIGMILSVSRALQTQNEENGNRAR